METENPRFFILGLPRTRTAWLSIVMSMCGRPCFHEGMRDHATFEDYAAHREAAGDADPTLIYWTPQLVERWPGARFVVIRRDPTESLADFIAAAPAEAAEAIRAGWATTLQAYTRACDLLRGHPSAMFVDFDQLADDAVIADVVAHCGGVRPSAAAVVRWQRLRVTTHLECGAQAPRLTAPVLPDARVHAGQVCDVSGLSAEMYSPAHFDLVAGWWQAHAGTALAEAALPPLGVLVRLHGRPVAACWCYECYGVPVAELTFPVTVPGLSLKDARRSVLYAVSCLISAAGKGYEPEAAFRFFKVLAPPGLARVLTRIGFQDALTERKSMLLTL